MTSTGRHTAPHTKTTALFVPRRATPQRPISLRLLVSPLLSSAHSSPHLSPPTSLRSSARFDPSRIDLPLLLTARRSASSQPTSTARTASHLAASPPSPTDSPPLRCPLVPPLFDFPFQSLPRPATSRFNSPRSVSLLSPPTSQTSAIPSEPCRLPEPRLAAPSPFRRFKPSLSTPYRLARPALRSAARVPASRTDNPRPSEPIPLLPTTRT